MSEPQPLRGVAGRIVLLVVVALLGYAVAGPTGCLVAGAAVLAGLLPAERPGAPVAMAAFVLLAAAALATVVEATPGPQSLSLSFPLEREVANDLGAAAGILLLAAVVISAVAERPDQPTSPAEPVPEGDALPPRWSLLVGGAVLLVAFLVRLVGAPAALDPGLDGVVAAISGGRDVTAGDVGLVPPAAPVLAALWPGGGGAALLAAGVLLVVLVAVLAHRTAPSRLVASPVQVAIAASVLAALLPAMWLLDLAAVVAAAVAVASVLLALPARITGGRAVAAGALAAAGVLARADVVVLGPVLVLWLLLDRRRSARTPARQVRAAAMLAAAWVVGLGSWTMVVRGATDGSNPLRSFGEHAGGTDLGGLALVAVLLLDAGVVLLAALGVRRAPRPLVRVLPLVVLPPWCVLAGLVLGGGIVGALSWGAPFVVVLASWPLAAWSRAAWAARREDGRPAQPEPRTSS